MKKCNETKFIQKFLNGELDKKKEESLKLHIKQCPLCQKEYAELKETDNFLSVLTEQDVPQYLNTKILYEINKIPTKRKNVFSLIPIAASFILAFIMGIYISNATLSNPKEDSLYFGSDSFYSLIEEVR